MASKISSALPAHLKPSGAGNGDANGGFARKHHGKSQSHVVSKDQSLVESQNQLKLSHSFVLDMARTCFTMPLRALCYIEKNVSVS